MMPSRNLTDLQMHCAAGHRAMQSNDALTAQNAYVSALQIEPNCWEAAINLALVFMSTNRLSAAIAMARRATTIDSARYEGWNNLGYICAAAGRFADAETALRKSLELNKSGATAETEHSLGQVLHALGKFSEAIECYDRALAQKPDNIDFIDHRGQSLLGAGRLTEGLIDNKIRWQFIMCHPLMASPIQEWNGESLAGKTVIVLHEQGFGDMFQCIRWVPMLKTKYKAKRVILSVPDTVADLARINKLADEVIAIRGTPKGGLGSIDYKIPMMTVPALFEASGKNIPSKSYISAPLRKALLPKSKNLKVGLIWGGKPMYAADQWRSMAADTLLPLVEIEGVSLFSLQADERSKELWQSGMAAWVADLSPHIKSWSDTAALIKELDLIVSVDTGPAHLAGAMGKAVALMIPEASCWRWFDHSTTETPWYPTMKLFRQERQGDWTSVISGVTEHIRTMRKG